MVPDELFTKMKQVVRQLSLSVPPRVLKAVAFDLLSSTDMKISSGEYTELDAQAFANQLITCCGIHVEGINELLAAFKELQMFGEIDFILAISQAVERDEEKAKIENMMVCIRVFVYSVCSVALL